MEKKKQNTWDFLANGNTVTVGSASHVGLVVAADLLDADVVFGLDVGLGGGVRPGQSHDAGDVLEVLLALHFDLRERRRSLVTR